jgi:hypothetical protein
VPTLCCTSRSLKLHATHLKNEKEHNKAELTQKKNSSLGIKSVWPLNKWRALDKKERGKGTPMNWKKNKRNIAKQIHAREKETDAGQCENWCVIADGDCVLRIDWQMAWANQM